MMLENFMMIFSGFTPIFGYLLSMMPLKRKPWLYIIEGAAASIFVLALFFPVFQLEVVVNPMLRNLALAEYILGFIIMLPLFSLKYKFPTALGLSLILFYVLTEIHEVYAFGKMYLGMFDNSVALQSYWVWYSPLNHLYGIVAGYLAVTVAKIKRSSFWFMLSLLLIGLLIEVLTYPLLIYGVYTFWEFGRRLIWIPILILMFMDWRRTDGSICDNST